jgi:hypothetical protein
MKKTKLANTLEATELFDQNIMEIDQRCCFDDFLVNFEYGLPGVKN